MTRGGKIFLGFALGALFFLYSLYGVIEDVLYKTPVRSWLWATLVLGIVLIVLAYIGVRNIKYDKRKAAEAEQKQQAELEAQQKEREEHIRAQIADEKEELERLLDGPYKIDVFRLTNCISPAVQDNIFLAYEGEKVFFAGDDKNNDAVWIVDRYDNRLGRLPNEAAARYQQEGAVAAFIKELEDDERNTIPYVHVFWKEKAEVQEYAAMSTVQIEIESEKPGERGHRQVESALPAVHVDYFHKDFLSKPCISAVRACFISLDVETTGLSRADDRMIEISAARFENGLMKDTFSTLINPGIPISPSASAVNGLTDADVADAPDEASAVTMFMDFIGQNAAEGSVPLVAHNASFDRAFLTGACMRSRISAKFWLQDTLALARRLPVYAKNNKLGTLAEHFNIEQKQGHRAQDDARVCGEIFLKLLDIQDQMWDQNAAALDDKAVAICQWYKGAVEGAGLSAELLTFHPGKYLRVKCGVKTVSKLNLSAKSPYVIIPADLTLPENCSTAAASKSEGPGVVRLLVSSPDDLEPIRASVVERYVRMYDETQNEPGEYLAAIPDLYNAISL